MIFLSPSEKIPEQKLNNRAQTRLEPCYHGWEAGPSQAKDSAAGSLLAAAQISWFQWAAVHPGLALPTACG